MDADIQADADQTLEAELDAAFPAPGEVSGAVVDCFADLPRTFREQWDLVADIDPETLVERVEEDFENEPDLRREILTSYLAQRLGYTRLFHRRESLVTEPLWDLLLAENFAQLDAYDRDILWMIAASTRRVRTYIEPRAAVAAIAIWRHDDGERRRFAELLLRRKSLWLDDGWLYDLVRTLARRAHELEVNESRRLLALARTQLEGGFADTVAHMGGFFFIRRYDHWYVGSARKNLINACDEAALASPFKNQAWLDLMVDAAVSKDLTHVWLERPVQAAIRLACLHDPEREERLRHFDRRCLYEADHPRLRALYETELVALRRGDARVGAWLVDEVERAAVENPVRAMRLLELIISETHPGPTVWSVRLIRAIDTSGVSTLDPLMERLLSLYVRTYHLEPYAVRLVKRLGRAVDWSKYADVSIADLDTYLMVSDYEAPFAAFEVEYEGVRMAHTDKDAAAYVRYFREKRDDPNLVTRFVQNFRTPTDWLATGLGESSAVDALFSLLMQEFESIARAGVHSEEVLETFHDLGTQIERLDELIERPIPGVQQALRARRHRPILLAGFVGALGGGLAPHTLGASAVFDAPLLMRLATDIAARSCWFYGFDPAEDPQLPLAIMAVALSGSSPESVDADDVRRLFHTFLIRKSLIVASISQGAIAQVLGPSLHSLFDIASSSRRKRRISTDRLVGQLTRRQASWRDRVVEGAAHFVLPTVEALIGAALNMAIIYDISESAEAVLTDRFLARKYSDWQETW